jgi:hypothetical protein
MNQPRCRSCSAARKPARRQELSSTARILSNELLPDSEASILSLAAQLASSLLALTSLQRVGAISSRVALLDEGPRPNAFEDHHLSEGLF